MHSFTELSEIRSTKADAKEVHPFRKVEITSLEAKEKIKTNEYRGRSEVTAIM